VIPSTLSILTLFDQLQWIRTALTRSSKMPKSATRRYKLISTLYKSPVNVVLYSSLLMHNSGMLILTLMEYLFGIKKGIVHSQSDELNQYTENLRLNLNITGTCVVFQCLDYQWFKHSDVWMNMNLLKNNKTTPAKIQTTHSRKLVWTKFVGAPPYPDKIRYTV
jgi:hypothetical protein